MKPFCFTYEYLSRAGNTRLDNFYTNLVAKKDYTTSLGG